MPNTKITAKCPRCGNTRFDSSVGKNPKPNDILICDRCGHRIKVNDLVINMSNERVKQAGEAIGDMVKAFNKKR